MCVKVVISPCIVRMERPSALLLRTMEEVRCLITAPAQYAVIIKYAATINIGTHFASQALISKKNWIVQLGIFLKPKIENESAMLGPLEKAKAGSFSAEKLKDHKLFQCF